MGAIKERRVWTHGTIDTHWQKWFWKSSSHQHNISELKNMGSEEIERFVQSHRTSMCHISD